jgi:hypothetical protein
MIAARLSIPRVEGHCRRFLSLLRVPADSNFVSVAVWLSASGDYIDIGSADNRGSVAARLNRNIEPDNVLFQAQDSW